MEAARVLREQQRLLAAEYGAAEPTPVEGEDLECDDIADVEHWVDVYSELVDFTRSLLESASTGSAGAGSATPDQELRGLMLQAQVQELHLTYWVDRLNRLRTQPGSTEDRSG